MIRAGPTKAAWRSGDGRTWRHEVTMTRCPCDERPDRLLLDIPAGLPRLPRQIGSFGEFRTDLLAGIATDPRFDDWRARAPDDFGVMLLEWWAYVLDILSFYVGEIANEQYLRTAARDASVKRIVELIGYRPKPPIAALATLAVFAEPGQPIILPPGAGFRSEAFDDEPPQVFETSDPTTVAPTLNEWTLAPIRPRLFGDGPLLLDPGTSAIAEGQIVLMSWGTALHAARVAAAPTVTALDGESYVAPKLDPAPTIPGSQQVASIGVATPGLRAGLNTFLGDAAKTATSSSVTLVLDAPYPQIRKGGKVVVENADGGELYAASIGSTRLRSVALGLQDGTGSKTPADSIKGLQKVGGGTEVQFARLGEFEAATTGTPAPSAPFTQLTLTGTVPNWLRSADAGAITVHANPTRTATVVRPGLSQVDLDDIAENPGLSSPVEPLQRETVGAILLSDAHDLGASLSANVAVDAEGSGAIALQSDARSIPALRTPVSVFGNLVSVSRGESVEEVLGSGDAKASFQSFTLTKKPLTYLSDASAANRRRSTLQIWVAGIRWQEVESLFFAGPEDRVYTVRRTVDGETIVGFGGQGFGSPVPTGAGNVVARYRYGAGAAAPPPRTITQLARPVKGVRRALNPLAAFGGDDGDGPDDVRHAAPASALSLGRAVSLIDFEAIARGHGGIVNAIAVTAWEEREQRAVVKVYFIPPDEDEAEQLRDSLKASLIASAALGTPVSACIATPVEKSIAVDFAVAEDRIEADIGDAVIAALADEEDGLLAPANLTIGAPVFTADILAAVRAVDGVGVVRGLLVDSAAAPFAIPLGEGQYLRATVSRMK
jgi:hypothetical protein